MAKFNFNDLLIGFDGKPLSNGVDGNLTFKNVCQATLWNTSDRTGEEKYKSYKLSRLIDSDKEVELTVEQVSEIKKQVGSMKYSALVIGLVFDKLEGIDNTKQTLDNTVLDPIQTSDPIQASPIQTSDPIQTSEQAN
jgi:hypothetical protein